MKMVTLRWLVEEGACLSGREWFAEQADHTVRGLIRSLLSTKEKEKHSWASWLLAHVLDYKGRVRYAVYTAEKVLHIYEKRYPNDKRLKAAILAAKKCAKVPTAENKAAAHQAANAAANAAYAAALFSAVEIGRASCRERV